MNFTSMVIIVRPHFRILSGNYPVSLLKKGKKNTSIKTQHQDNFVFFDLDGIVQGEFAPETLNVAKIY